MVVILPTSKNMTSDSPTDTALASMQAPAEQARSAQMIPPVP